MGFLSLDDYKNSPRGNIPRVMGMFLMAIIGILILFKIATAIIPEVMTSGDELNASGVPLGSLFVGSGVVIIIVMVALLLGVIYLVLGKNKN